MHNFLKKTKVYHSIEQIRKFLPKGNLKLRHFFLPCLLSICAAAFEGIGFGLLIPLIKGILTNSYDFIEKIPVLSIAMIRIFSLFGNKRSVVFISLMVFGFVAIILKNAFTFAASARAAFLTTRLDDNLRRVIYERYLSFGKIFFDQASTGHLYLVLVEFSGAISRIVTSLNGALHTLFSLIVYLGIMITISWQLTISLALVFPLLHFVLRWLIRKIKKSSNSYADVSKELGKKIANSLFCIPLIKAYRSEDRERKWFNYASRRVQQMKFSIQKKQALVAPTQEIIMVSVIFVLVGVVALLSARGKASDLAGYFVFFVLLKRAITGFSIFGSVASLFAGISGQIKEVYKVFDDKGKHSIPDGAKEFKKLENSIEINNLEFSYPRGKAVLKGINISFKKGTTTAIIGASGGGKTTLINLLMRFYDTTPGSILINGQDIRGFTLKSLRSKIALVSQESFLFNAPLRFNLGYGFIDKISDEFIMKAAKKARLYDFIKNLPNGLDTEVGDRGIKLSGGEKQRVSITRAIIKGVDIIMLDEATSSLDSITEKLIQEALDELIKDKTTIVVAHRLSTIKYADKVIVLEGGKIVEQGELQALLDEKGRFYQYWQEQKFY